MVNKSINYHYIWFSFIPLQIAGATVAGLGLYFLMKENDISAIMGHAFMTIVASVVVAAGLLMILTSVVGIVGAIALSKELILGVSILIST